MAGVKRPLSPDSPRRDRTKRPIVCISDDDEDSLESILAQIKAQEDSEALARRLEEEWNAPGPSNATTLGSTRAHLPDGDVILISDDEDEGEDDAALARRLAREWAFEDANHDVSLSSSTGHAIASKGKTRSASTSNSARKPSLECRVDHTLDGHSRQDASPVGDEQEDETHASSLAASSRCLAVPTNQTNASTRPPNTDLEQYKELFTGVSSCPCGAKLPSPRGHVMYSQQVPPPNLLHLLHAPCTACKKNHCRGCMSPVPCSRSCKGKPQNEDCPVETCCADIRVLALFEALGGFDRQYLGERATANERAREAASNSRKNQIGGSVGPGGTGYGTGRGGTGYGGTLSYGMYDELDSWGYRGRARGRARWRGSGASMADGVPQRNALAAHFDEIIVCALNTITSYLPSPYSENAQIYDMLPHPATGTLLLLSQLPDLLASLLRNDSVTDWIARIDVYQAMLALLRRMADCELTLEVLTSPRYEMAKSCGLEEWMWGDGEIVWERDESTGDFAPAPPLYAHFKKLTKQCETFLAGASSMLETAVDGEDAETMVKATSLCGDIIAVKDDIERAMVAMGKDPAAVLGERPASSPSSEPAGKGKGRDPAIDLERTYARECERLAFKHVSLSQPKASGTGLEYPGYKYAAELARTANATRSPKDRLHLVKELAVMATSLPPGVWVRVDEVRNDAIKIMIAGPEGTPYAGGLFEFDCFIPLEYPNKPPLMHLRTTGGGSVRFNPNLYNCGKVCLSLLGTWQGRPEEQWSRKSTLLQVVVSIQSMILVELPYFNEPGFGQANPKCPGSIHYNKNIMLQTTRWAIAEWLKDEHKTSLWGDVIASHFITRHAKIHKCLQAWAIEEPNIRKYRTGITGANYMPLPPSAMYGGSASLPLPPMYPMDVDEDEDDEDFVQLGSLSTVYPSSSTIVHGGSMSSSHVRARRRQGPTAATLRGPVDLLAQYEEGIQKIRGWGLVNTEEH